MGEPIYMEGCRDWYSEAAAAALEASAAALRDAPGDVLLVLHRHYSGGTSPIGPAAKHVIDERQADTQTQTAAS